jgi:Rod binding domain-containing protein
MTSWESAEGRRNGMTVTGVEKSGGEGAAGLRTRDEKTWGACVEFEGVLVGQMMRQMKGKLAERGILPTGTAGEMFWNQYCSALGEEMAARSPLGVAETMYKAVERETGQVKAASLDNTGG